MCILPEVNPSDLLVKNELRLMQKRAIVGAMGLVFLAGCAGGSGLTAGRGLITVSPSSATVQAGGMQQFTATVTPGANPAVTWSVGGIGCTGADCGTIDGSGKYTAPATVLYPATVTVNARAVVDPTNIGTAIVNIGSGNMAHFMAVGSMTTTRAKHTATLLPSGKVLIAGGSDGMQPLASAELYDPASKTFTTAGSMTAARAGHTATLLRNGKVLIAGGSDGSQPLASAELYDPTTGTFAPTGSMKTAGVGVRAAADSVIPAVLLASGKVLFVGGSAELYDPVTGTFALAGPYADAASISWNTATLLPDGRVLLVGGSFGATVGEAELFDPQSGTFSLTGSRHENELNTATLLTDGTVLVVTASFDFSPDDADIYDPASGIFTHIGQTIGFHGYSAAVRLADGTVLISGGEAVGGSGSSFTELYLPATRTFVPADSMTTGRQMHTATLLPDGTVLIAGGMTSTAEIYTR